MKNILPILLFLCWTSLAFSQVTINEVYYDPPGTDVGCFTELYGTPGTNLSGWKLLGINGNNGENYSTVIIWEIINTIRIPQDGYFVIAQEDTVPNVDFVSSAVNWQNGPDNVLLINASGDTVDAVGYGIFGDDDFFVGEITPAPDASGKSIGRIKDGVDSDNNAVDFSIQESPSPGEPNWVNFDLAIYDSSLSYEISENSIDFQVHVFNLGAMDYDGSNASLEFYANDNFISSYDIMNDISSLDSTAVFFDWQNPQSGLYKIDVVLSYSADQNDDNNFASTYLRIGKSGIIINEIMYDPLTDNSEWFEIYNCGQDTINLRDWHFADSNLSPKILTSDTLLISPNKYLIIAQSIADFVLQYPELDTNFVIQPKNWQTLNNGDDMVILYDFYSIEVEKVYYFDVMGGGDGVSLERIDPQGHSDDFENWHGCTMPIGATPLAPNSVYTPELPSAGKIEASPNPFSPDGDGKDDITRITYQIPEVTSEINLCIYDVKGRLVHKILQGSETGSHNTIIWDGTNDEGKLLPIGIYIVYYEAINAGNGSDYSGKTTVVLAKRL